MINFSLDIKKLNITNPTINSDINFTPLFWWERYNVVTTVAALKIWRNMPTFFTKYKVNNSFKIWEFLFDSLRSTLGTIPSVLKHVILDNHVKFNQGLGYVLKTINGIVNFSKTTKIINNKIFNISLDMLSAIINVTTIYNNIPIYDYNKNNIYNYYDLLLNEAASTVSAMTDLLSITTIFYPKYLKTKLVFSTISIFFTTAANFSLLGNAVSISNILTIIPLLLTNYLDIFNFIYDNYDIFASFFNDDNQLQNLIVDVATSNVSNNLAITETTPLLNDYQKYRNYNTFVIDKINIIENENMKDSNLKKGIKLTV